MKTMHSTRIAAALGFAIFAPLSAQEKKAEPAPKQTFITNVQIFDGKTDKLTAGNVLIEGKLIKEVGASVKAPAGATTIDGGGGTLMPGLIDCHSHLAMATKSLAAFENSTWEEIGARTALVAEDALMDGFTTCRDVGGMNGKGVKRMIDSGELRGPRIFPSGGFIGATSSHSDFKTLTMRNPRLNGTNDSNIARLELGFVVDGRADIMTAARRNLQLGATQLKVMAGGGVATEFDPWHSTTYTLDEMKAAVEVADDYGTYVCAHINQPKTIKRALEAGIKCIEHAFVMDEESVKLMVEKGAYLSTQLTGTSSELASLPSLTPENLRKLKLAHGQMKNYFTLVKKYKPKQVFAVDAVVMPRLAMKQQRDHEIWLFAKHFGNFAMLKAATSTAGELVAMCGPLTSYHDGPIGLIEAGAYADLLIVDGNPLEDITVIGGNELWMKAPMREAGVGIETMKVIMKDGVIYKNTLK
ncbi:amidohydrolase family protein [Haloferula sp.]|uniref:metal-dependent hydrolase family protein n=1 Tax=Haloferula sp. TaxID=2497595 RepID=UPI00329DB429